MAHTPGPWYALPGLHNISIRYKTGDKYFPMVNVASVRGRFGTDFPYGDSDSNVRLIVAAPDLLESIKNYFEVYENLDGEPGWVKRVSDAKKKCMAAIAKATGEQ